VNVQRNLASRRRGADVQSMTWRDGGQSHLIDSESVLALCARQAAIDADCFHLLANEALRRRDIASYEAALAVYDSDLIREEGDAGSCAERDEGSRKLRDQLALGLAEARERCGDEEHSVTPAAPRATPMSTPPRPAPAAPAPARPAPPAPARKGRLIRLYGDNGIRARAVRQRKGEPS
jgi:hypothetical protein